MSLKLYEITEKYQQVFSMIDEYYDENGEINPKILMKLDDIAELAENKAIAVASFIKNAEAERAAIEVAKRAMADRESRLNNKVNYLMEYLKTNMEACGISEITRSPYFTIKLKKCPLSVDVINEKELPVQYLKVKEVITPDKIKMKEDLIAGVLIQGAALKQNTRVEIR